MSTVEPAPAATPPPTEVGSVHLSGAVLAMIGNIDRAAALGVPAGTLTHVATVDLTRATYLGADALMVLLRCLQHTHHQRPPTRLQVRGADQRTREQLDVLGVTPLLDLHA